MKALSENNKSFNSKEKPRTPSNIPEDVFAIHPFSESFVGLPSVIGLEKTGIKGD